MSFFIIEKMKKYRKCPALLTSLHVNLLCTVQRHGRINYKTFQSQLNNNVLAKFVIQFDNTIQLTIIDNTGFFVNVYHLVRTRCKHTTGVLA